jgi:hypothetical protein
MSEVNLSSSEINIALSLLELKGWIKEEMGKIVKNQ